LEGLVCLCHAVDLLADLVSANYQNSFLFPSPTFTLKDVSVKGRWFVRERKSAGKWTCGPTRLVVDDCICQGWSRGRFSAHVHTLDVFFVGFGVRDDIGDKPGADALGIDRG
jgi:hypothetical protein